MAILMSGNQPPLNPEGDAIIGERKESKVYVQETSGEPQADVDLNRLLAENEWLRQELFYDQNNDMNRLINCLHRHAFTLKHVVNFIALIHQLTGIKKQDIYGIVYATLVNSYGSAFINFKDKKKTESKLRYIWRMGYLPQLTWICSGMYDSMKYISKIAPSEFSALTAALQSKLDKQKQKVRKGVVKKVPF